MGSLSGWMVAVPTMELGLREISMTLNIIIPKINKAIATDRTSILVLIVFNVRSLDHDLLILFFYFFVIRSCKVTTFFLNYQIILSFCDKNFLIQGKIYPHSR
jgi:hypothetical protein